MIYTNRDLGDEQQELNIHNVNDNSGVVIGDYWAKLSEEDKDRIRKELSMPLKPETKV